ncbi:MAG: hypothetical protein AAGA28_10545 [Pseudomonadota bacterium]
MARVTRIPFTLCFLVIMVLANMGAGTWSGVLADAALSDWGLSHLSVRQGEVFRLLSATFLSHDLGMLLRQLVFAAAVIGAYEWTEGTKRAMLVFLSIDLAGTLIVLFGILPLFVRLHPSMDASALAVYDVGMSAGGFGLIGAFVARLRHRWLYLVVICLALSVKVSIAFDAIADSVHILCLFMGFVLQRALNSRRRNPDIAPF